VALLAVLKLIATAVCYASGNAGGIFGPSLFIGAMFGAAVGHLAHAVAPAHTAAVGAYALVGMGAVFAGVVRTPMTSVIMIFELTRDYSIIVPLMLANLIAFFVSHRLQPAGVYEALAEQDGIHLPAHTATHAARELRIERAMRPVERLMTEDLTVADVLAQTIARGDAGAVVLRGGTPVLVSRADLEAAVQRGDGANPVGHAIAMSGDRSGSPEPGFLHLHPDQPLSLALQRMGQSGREVLPVVSRGDVRILLGVVTLGDVLDTYHVLRLTSAAK
jgi:CIC family chloride channel protein